MLLATSAVVLVIFALGFQNCAKGLTNSKDLASSSNISNLPQSNPPIITYANTTLGLQVGTAMKVLSIWNTGGAISNLSVSPALPPGLVFDTATGDISGTPTVAQSQASYTVKASNSSGASTIILYITISAVAQSPTPTPPPVSPTPTASPTPTPPAVSPTPTPKASATPTPTPAPSATPSASPSPSPSATPSSSPSPTPTPTPTPTPVPSATPTPSPSSSPSPNPSPTPPVNFYYDQQAATYTVNTYAVNGARYPLGFPVQSFSISPNVPAGLYFSTYTGGIVGTPTAFTPVQNYVVTLYYVGGSVTDTISIAVNDIAPLFTYQGSSFNFQAGTFVNLPTTATGGAISSFAVSPALPAGLTLDITNGTISGTPAAAANSAVYAVISTGTSGQTYSLNLTITVNSATSGNTFSYLQPNLNLTQGTQINDDTAVLGVGFAPTSFSLANANDPLPYGIYLNAKTGAIYGNPLVTVTNVYSNKIYYINATNGTDSATAKLTITVNTCPAGQLLNSAGVCSTSGTYTCTVYQGGPVYYWIDPQSTTEQGLPVIATAMTLNTPLDQVVNKINYYKVNLVFNMTLGLIPTSCDLVNQKYYFYVFGGAGAKSTAGIVLPPQYPNPNNYVLFSNTQENMRLCTCN